VAGWHLGGNLLGLAAADLSDVPNAIAVPVVNEHRGVLTAQLPGDLLAQTGEMPDVGGVVVAAGALADRGNGAPSVRAITERD
jgi:hypothetical protein